MDLSKLTEKSQAALMEAQNIATRNEHQSVDVEHLLLALLEQDGGLIPSLTDMAGRRFNSGQTKWAAPAADDHNYELENRRRLIRSIAGRIDPLILGHDWGGCWFAAPSEVNRPIVEALSPAARVRLVKNLPLDLARTPQRKLLAKFLDS